MSSSYKVTYFPMQGLAEPIRWLLVYGKIDFEDIRIKKEDWPSVKNGMPFGKVPTLEINGKVSHQHAAICRYLAKELNLLGKTNEDALAADTIIDTITDFRDPLASHHYDNDPVSKEAKRGPLQKDVVPFYMDRFEKMVKDNNGYFVNGQLTYADIFFVAISDYLELMSGGLDIFKGRPHLAALKAKIMENGSLQKWVAQRPPNAY